MLTDPIVFSPVPD